jgi:hypothetical protein
MYKKIRQAYEFIKYKFKQFLNYLVLISDKEWHKDIYNYSSYLSIILILATYTGVIYINPEYTLVLHNFIVYYVCIILLVRFNPFIKKNPLASYVEFNRNVAFTAGIILLTTAVAKSVSDIYIAPLKLLYKLE